MIAVIALECRDCTRRIVEDNDTLLLGRATWEGWDVTVPQCQPCREAVIA